MGLLSGIAGLIKGSNLEDLYKNIEVPDPETMKLQLEEYVLQGLITPEQADVALQDPTAYQQIMSDPALKEAQMGALSGLQDVYEQGGLTATSKARLNDIADQENIQQRGAREAIMSDAAQKGTSGSGLEFLSKLKNQQASADRQSDRDTDVFADAEQRALEAMIQSGNMAGDIRTQDFGEQSRIADAKDAISRFNTANRNSTNMYNTGVRNDAQTANLAARQNIADMNTGQRNKQQQYNKNVYQTEFDNKLRKAGGQTGAAQQDRNNFMDSLGQVEGGAADIIGSAYGVPPGTLTKKKGQLSV